MILTSQHHHLVAQEAVLLDVLQQILLRRPDLQLESLRAAVGDQAAATVHSALAWAEFSLDEVRAGRPLPWEILQHNRGNDSARSEGGSLD